MASSSCWKLRALIKKNLLIMKRNPCSTAFEILFPIALILLCYVIRLAFELEKFYFKDEEIDITNYIQNTSVLYDSDYSSPNLTEVNEDLGLTILPALKICSPINEKFEPRPIIASIGLPIEIQQRILMEAGFYAFFVSFKDYESIDEMENAVKDKAYGKDDDHPLICFGISFKKEGHKYDYSLHYFDSIFSQGVQDVPNIRNGIFNQFSTGPNLESYRKYQKSGYTYIMKLFYNKKQMIQMLKLISLWWLCLMRIIGLILSV